MFYMLVWGGGGGGGGGMRVQNFKLHTTEISRVWWESKSVNGIQETIEVLNKDYKDKESLNKILVPAKKRSIEKVKIFK